MIGFDRDNIPGISPGVGLLNELRPYVRQCGNRRRPAWRMGERRLLDYLLVYIAEGRGTFSIGGSRFDVEPNDLFWISPDTLHAMEGYAPGMICPFVHFDLAYRKQLSHWEFSIPEGMTDLSDLRTLMHPPHDPIFDELQGCIRSYTNQRVGILIQEVCEEAARAQPFSQIFLSGLMTEIIAEILRGKAGLGEQHDQQLPAVEQAAEYIRDGIQESGFTIENAAARCGLSTSHFRKLFGLHYGCSPREYLRTARIRTAKELMLTSIMNLSEIARAVGYTTVHNFSRAFKNEEGISPSEYRTCGIAPIKVDNREVSYSR